MRSESLASLRGFCKFAWILAFLVGIQPAMAQVRADIRVGSLFQIYVLVKDPASTDLNPIPLYDREFQLLFNLDSSVFKLWSPKDNPKVYFASGDSFRTPIDSGSHDIAVNNKGQTGPYCPSGYRCFLLSSIKQDSVSITITDDNQATTTFAKLFFYFPTVKFYDASGNEITSASTLSSMTGDTVKITAKAFTPSGQLDTTFQSQNGFQWLKPIIPNTSAGLEFYNVDNLGKPSAKVDSIQLKKGVAEFYVRASSPINGSDFALTYSIFTAAGSWRPADTIAFPGKLSVSYPTAPGLDSAAIFDMDGDGLGDSIRAWFNSPVDSLPKAPLMSWPLDSTLQPVSTTGAVLAWQVGATQLGVTVDEKPVPLGKTGAGTFGITVKSESGSNVPVTTSLKDHIGPVVQAVTLIPGKSGAPDTLVARFNKELDSSSAQGSVFLLNGSPLQVSGTRQSERNWRFVVAPGTAVGEGDSLRIASTGPLLSADGNSPAANNRAAIVHKAGTLPPLSADGNAFFDSDLDGRLDSVALTFAQPLNALMVDSLDLRFIWKDTLGNPIELHPSRAQLAWDVSNPTTVTWKFDAKALGIMPNLTSINGPEYGYGNIINRYEVNGVAFADTIPVAMRDRMAPVLVSARIWPVSNTAKTGDSLALTFSEPVDSSAVANLDFVEFQLSGRGLPGYSLSKASWSDSGRVLGLRVAKDIALSQRPNPGDSVRILMVDNGVSDRLGNVMTRDGREVMLVGDARVLSEISPIVGVSRSTIGEPGPDGQPLPTMGVTFMDQTVSVQDLRERSLGILLDVGQSTLGNLDTVQQALDLDLTKIGMSWKLEIYTNIGGYVASSSGSIQCDDQGFHGNCFENRKRVYISWNLMSQDGRKVGFGVYIAKLTVRVWGSQSYELNKIYLWGVRPGTHRAGVLE